MNKLAASYHAELEKQRLWVGCWMISNTNDPYDKTREDVKIEGHRVPPLGDEHPGQTGTIADLHRHFGIDADASVAATDRLSVGKRVRLRMIG